MAILERTNLAAVTIIKKLGGKNYLVEDVKTKEQMTRSIEQLFSETGDRDEVLKAIQELQGKAVAKECPMMFAAGDSDFVCIKDACEWWSVDRCSIRKIAEIAPEAVKAVKP